MRVEKRKNVRYMVRENAFAAIGPKYTKVGRLKDVSISGLGFEYIAGAAPENDNSQIDIFLTGGDYHLYKLPCKVVYIKDAYIPRVSRRHVRYLTTKRCGVEFGELSKTQFKQLKAFIDTYTIGPA